MSALLGGASAALALGGALVLVLQLCDAVLSIVDTFSVRDSDEPDELTRRRFRELLWSLAITATLAVLVAFGADAAARQVWDRDDPAGAVGILGAAALGAFLAGLLAVIAILRRERPTYARLRRDLRDRASMSLTTDEVAEFETRLERADRLRARRPRAAFGVRLGGAVLAVAIAILFAGTFFSTGRDVGWLFVAGGVLSVTAFAIAARAAAIRADRLGTVYDAQRAEVVALLERARIPQRGSVPGLRDRVARALAILREKQR